MKAVRRLGVNGSEGGANEGSKLGLSVMKSLERTGQYCPDVQQLPNDASAGNSRHCGPSVPW